LQLSFSYKLPINHCPPQVGAVIYSPKLIDVLIKEF